MREKIKEILKLTNKLNEIREKYKQKEKEFWNTHPKNYYEERGGYTPELEQELFKKFNEKVRLPKEKEIKNVDKILNDKFGIVYGCADYGNVDYCMDEEGIKKLCKRLLE